MSLILPIDRVVTLSTQPVDAAGNQASFDASDQSSKKVVIDGDYVNKQLNALLKDEDLSHYIL